MKKQKITTALALISAGGLFIQNLNGSEARYVPQTKSTITAQSQRIQLMSLPDESGTNGLSTNTVIKIYHTSGPSMRSEHYPEWIKNWADYLDTGIAPLILPHTGGRAGNPTGLYFPDRLRADDLIESTNGPVWTNYFITYWGFTAENPSGTKLANYRITLSGDDVYDADHKNLLGNTYILNTISYDERAKGIIWTNGTTGSTNKPVVSGTPTQVVNKLRFTGVAMSFIAHNTNDVKDIFNYVSNYLHNLTCVVDELNDNGQVIASATNVWSTVPMAQTNIISLAISSNTNGITVMANGIIGMPGLLQSSTDLKTWVDYASLSEINNSVSITNSASTNGNMRFFRLKR